jgi:hypothetical protein
MWLLYIMPVSKKIGGEPKKRCPNGTRRNKAGDCVSKDQKDPKKTANIEIAPLPKKRCPKGTRKNKMGICVPNKEKQATVNVDVVDVAVEESSASITMDEANTEIAKLMENQPPLKIPKETIMHVIAIVTKHSPAELRRRNDPDFGLPFESYPDDKSLLLYLFREIMDLSINYTRDGKKKTMTPEIVDKVIKRDDTLNELLQ